MPVLAFFYGWDEMAVLTGLVLLSGGAFEVGYRAGRRTSTRVDEAPRSQLFGVQASILALLALLLGFTFSLSIARHDVRQEAVLEEANAIGTAYLRTTLIDDPRGARMREALRRYVDERVSPFTTDKLDAGRVRAAVERSEAIHEELWKDATAAAREAPQAHPPALLVQALNDVIDIHAKRIAHSRNHVPPIVLILLVTVAVLAMGYVGYGFGLVEHHGAMSAGVLVVLVAAILMVVLDLDSPQAGIIRVNQQAMFDLQRSLARDAEAAK